MNHGECSSGLVAELQARAKGLLVAKLALAQPSRVQASLLGQSGGHDRKLTHTGGGAGQVCTRSSAGLRMRCRVAELTQPQR